MWDVHGPIYWIYINDILIIEKDLATIRLSMCMFISVAILLFFSLRAPCGGCSLIHPLLQPLSLQSFSFPLENSPHSLPQWLSFPAYYHPLLLACMSLEPNLWSGCRFPVSSIFVSNQFMTRCFTVPNPSLYSLNLKTPPGGGACMWSIINVSHFPPFPLSPSKEGDV